MIVEGILVMIALLLLVGVSAPIQILVRETPSQILLVSWLFARIRLYLDGNELQAELRLPFKRLQLLNEEEKDPKKPSKKKTDKKTDNNSKEKKKRRAPKKKWTLDRGLELLQLVKNHPAIPAIITQLIRLLRRLMRSTRIKRVRLEVGLEDLFWQALLSGIIPAFSLPQKIRVGTNFQGKKELEMLLTLSIWRILWAIAVLLVRFPYLRSYRLYKQIMAF